MLSSVGGFTERWLLVTSGDALWEASRSFHSIGPGETIVCPSALQMISADCTLERTGRLGAVLVRVNDSGAVSTPNVSPPMNTAEEFDDVASKYLPGFLSRRAELGGVDWTSELRWATVVFINVALANDSLESLQNLVAMLQREFQRAGGSLEQLAIDEKGLNGLGTFGLPPHSHKDDAVRALRAAAGIELEMQRKKIPARIGVASGLIYLGDVGTEARRHIALLGPAINFAARLAGAGAGLLCDAVTAEAAGRNFAFSIPSELPINGLEGSFRVFRPERELPVVSVATTRPIVGRYHELASLAERLERLEGGKGGLAVIFGEPGIGKTRLLQEVLHRAKAQGCRVLSANPPTDSGGAAFELWSNIVGQLASAESCRTADEPSVRLVSDTIDNIGGLASEQETASPGTWAAKFRARVVASLQAGAEDRLVLSFEDLHRADSESLSLLETVVEQVPTCLILATARMPSEQNSADLPDFLRIPGPDSLKIGSLSRSEIASQAAAVLGIGDIPNVLLDHLVTRTGGHPLYVEELALALRACGHIAISGGVCQIATAVLSRLDIEAPPSLRAAVTMRVDRLPPRLQLMIKVASVLGTSFLVGTLHSIFPTIVDAQVFSRDVSELCRQELLVAVDPARSEELQFKHPLTRDIVYDLLPEQQRRSLHRAALRILHREAEAEEWINTSGLSALATHAERGGVYEAAIDYIEKLTELALKHYANREAIDLLRHAFGIAETHGVPLSPTRRASWWALLGDAHHEMSEHAEASSDYSRALEALEDPPPQTKIQLGLRTARQLATQIGRRALARKISIGGEQGNRAAFLAHVYQRLSETAFFQNEAGAVLHHTLYAVNLAETAGAERQTAIGYASLAIGLGLNGVPRLGRFYSSLSLEIAQRHPHAATRAYAHLLAMVFAFGQGDWNILHRQGEEACRLYLQIGDEFRYHSARFMQLFALTLTGEFERAEVLQADIAQIPSCHDYQQTRFWSVTAALLLDLLADRSPAHHLQQVQDLTIDRLDRSDMMLGHGLSALALLRLDEREQALTAAETALAILLDRPPMIGGGYVFGAAGPAEVFLELASDPRATAVQRTAAMTRAELAIRALKNYARRVPVSRPHILLLQGRYASLSGKSGRAHSLWSRGQTNAAALGMRYDLQLLQQVKAEGTNPATNERLHGRWSGRDVAPDDPKSV